MTGAFNFGLKAIAKAMHAAGFIETTWGDGPTDGLGAMIGAWWCDAEARRFVVPMIELDLMREIAAYNAVDVRVMADVVGWLAPTGRGGPVPDYERLQGTLDDIAGTVEWAASWLEYLETEEVRVGTTDLDILKADLARLRIVANTLVPSRVRDTSSGRRWYRAPDEAWPRHMCSKAIPRDSTAVLRAEFRAEATGALGQGRFPLPCDGKQDKRAALSI